MTMIGVESLRRDFVEAAAKYRTYKLYDCFGLKRRGSPPNEILRGWKDHADTVIATSGVAARTEGDREFLLLWGDRRTDGVGEALRHFTALAELACVVFGDLANYRPQLLSSPATDTRHAPTVARWVAVLAQRFGVERFTTGATAIPGPADPAERKDWLRDPANMMAALAAHMHGTLVQEPYTAFDECAQIVRPESASLFTLSALACDQLANPLLRGLAPLTKYERIILESLPQGERVMISDLAPAGDMSRDTAGKSVNLLEGKGYVDRKGGVRSGVAITERGMLALRWANVESATGTD